MPKGWQIKPNKSLRENAKNLLPVMFDEFINHAARVYQHPRLKRELHMMRIAGKPMRYALEVFEIGFGKAFKKCFEEVKHLIELMGMVHDRDVTIPLLESQMREIRMFNRSLTGQSGKISTKGIRQFIQHQKRERNRLYLETCAMLKKWKKENFRTRLVSAMNRKRRSTVRALAR